VIQFKSNGECFLYDINSAHGTRLNKVKILPGTHVPLKPGDQIRFGESSRIYLFQTHEDLNNEIEENKETENHVGKSKQKENIKQKRADPLSWADEVDDEDMRSYNDDRDDIDDINMDNDVEPKRKLDENASYRNDPKKALRSYLERRNCILEFEIEESGPGHAREYTARVRLPVESSLGQLYGEATAGNKKSAEREAALDACIKLDKEGYLRSDSASGSYSLIFFLI
jgi:hypothetical protein